MRTPREVGVFVRRGDRLLVLHRIVEGYWHIVAGVVEAHESFEEAGRRELREEAGLDARLVRVGDPIPYPVTDELRETYGYPDDVHVITTESFLAEAPPGWEPRLNEEHDTYQWCTVDEAIDLFHWPETREAARLIAERHADIGRSRESDFR